METILKCVWSIRTVVYFLALAPALLVFSEGAAFSAIIYAIFTVPVWALSALYENLYRSEEQIKPKNTRGREMLDHHEARSEAERARGKEDRGILWGGLRIPSTEATMHFCVVGAVGSGKSLTIKSLMQDQLPLIKPGSDRRALIYDSKQDMLPILSGMGLNTEVLVLNPLDKRSVAWDIAADVTTLAHASELANILVPAAQGESQPFFSDATRILLKGVLSVFIKREPGNWTLRQVLLTMRSMDKLNAVLRSDPRTLDVAEQFLDGAPDNVTLRGIRSTIATKLHDFELIAAAWDKTERKFSIREWVSGSSILVLGNDETSRSTIDLINQVLVKFASEQTLSLPDTQQDEHGRRTWFILDEFREAGQLPGLQEIVLRGRSKGCCVVLGFQDIEGLREVYSDKLANELVGQCGQKALLRLESPATAEWASQVVSKKEYVDTNFSHGQSSQGGSINYSEQVVERDEVLPSEFLSMPRPSHRNGLNGVYLSAAIGVYQHNFPFDELLASLPQSDPATPAYLPRAGHEQDIDPWRPEDDYLLGIVLEGGIEQQESPSLGVTKPAQPTSELGKIGRIEFDR